jgi:hypothetical protein
MPYFRIETAIFSGKKGKFRIGAARYFNGSSSEMVLVKAKSFRFL